MFSLVNLGGGGNGISLISSWGGKAARRRREGRGHAPRLTDGLQRRTLRLRPVARGIRGEGPITVSKEKNNTPPPSPQREHKRVIFRASRPMSLRRPGKKKLEGEGLWLRVQAYPRVPNPNPNPSGRRRGKPLRQIPSRESENLCWKFGCNQLEQHSSCPQLGGRRGGELKYQMRAK